MTKPVNVALVGLGWWGKKIFSIVESIQNLIQITLVIEPNLDSASDFCSKKNVKLSENYSDALNNPAIEAVILVTPHGLHEDQIAQAVAAGKHIFCEKPIALSKAGAEKAVYLCQKANLVLGTGHERRWEPPILELLTKADLGELGRIHQIEANFSHDKFLSLDRKNWRLSSDQAPAAGMTATGIHLLDLSVRLLGPGKTAYCICESLSSDLPQGDTVGAYIEFENGGTSYISASLANPFISRFAVFGSKGWIEVRDKAHVEAPAGWTVLSSYTNGPIITTDVPPSEPVKDNLISFARATRGLEIYPITAAHIVNNIALLEAVCTSALSRNIENVR